MPFLQIGEGLTFPQMLTLSNCPVLWVMICDRQAKRLAVSFCFCDMLLRAKYLAAGLPPLSFQARNKSVFCELRSESVTATLHL